MSDPTELLMVTPRASPYSGGVETHVAEVSRRMVQAGVNVTVLTADPSRRLDPIEEVHGVTLRRVPAWPRGRDYFFAPGMRRIIAERQWSLMHLHSYHTLVAPLAMMSAGRHSLPYVVTFHGGGHSSRLRNSMRGAQLRALRPMLARAEKLVALAEFEIPFYGERLCLPADRFELIPNGGDLPRMPTGRPRTEGASGMLIASVGRLERYKGHQRVIAALPHVLRRDPDARLWIAGGGPYEAALRRLAQNLGVTARVDIHEIPHSDRNAMAMALSGANVMTLMSDFETHPVAVLEARSLGVPAVVADTSGLGELARRGLARSVPVDCSPTVLADALCLAAREARGPDALVLPTWDDCAAQLLDLYRRLES